MVVNTEVLYCAFLCVIVDCMKEKKRVNVALPESLYKRLQQINAKTGIPVTVIVQQAVNRYIETQKATA